MRKLFLCSIAALLIGVLAGCGGGGHSPYTIKPVKTTGKWTVLVYMSTDSTLNDFATNDINEMERGVPLSTVSDPAVRVLVQLDRPADGVTRRYMIAHDKTRTDGSVDTIVSKAQTFSEQDMSKPSTLSDFLTWGCETAPTDHYVVVLWSHGSGWDTGGDSSSNVSTRSIIYDPDTRKFMSDIDVASAIASAQGLHGKLAILGLDACLMNTMEVAYQTQGLADYMVGSEEETPAPGFMYTAFLNAIVASNGAISEEDLAKLMADSAINDWKTYGVPDAYNPLPYTTSVVDLTKIGTVASALDSMAQRLIDIKTTYASELTAVHSSMGSFSDSYRHLYDLHEYAAQVAQNIPDATLQQRAATLESAIEQCVVRNNTTYYAGRVNPTATGISIYIPNYSYFNSYDATSYGLLNLSRDTAWNEWLSVCP